MFAMPSAFAGTFAVKVGVNDWAPEPAFLMSVMIDLTRSPVCSAVSDRPTDALGPMPIESNCLNVADGADCLAISMKPAKST